MISEDTVKQVYFYCNNNDPNGLYTDPQDESLDVLEFARKLEAVIEETIREKVRLQEHTRCVEIVRDMNKFIAQQLENQRFTDKK